MHAIAPSRKLSRTNRVTKPSLAVNPARAGLASVVTGLVSGFEFAATGGCEF